MDSNVIDIAVRPIDLPVYIPTEPSTMEGLPDGYALWRFAFKRRDGNWRIGAIKAKSRESAALILQSANTASRFRMMLKTSVEKVEAAYRRGEVPANG